MSFMIIPSSVTDALGKILRARYGDHPDPGFVHKAAKTVLEALAAVSQKLGAVELVLSQCQAYGLARFNAVCRLKDEIAVMTKRQSALATELIYAKAALGIERREKEIAAGKSDNAELHETIRLRDNTAENLRNEIAAQNNAITRLSDQLLNGGRLCTNETIERLNRSLEKEVAELRRRLAEPRTMIVDEATERGTSSKPVDHDPAESYRQKMLAVGYQGMDQTHLTAPAGPQLAACAAKPSGEPAEMPDSTKWVPRSMYASLQEQLACAVRDRQKNEEGYERMCAYSRKLWDIVDPEKKSKTKTLSEVIEALVVGRGSHDPNDHHALVEDTIQRWRNAYASCLDKLAASKREVADLKAPIAANAVQYEHHVGLVEGLSTSVNALKTRFDAVVRERDQARADLAAVSAPVVNGLPASEDLNYLAGLTRMEASTDWALHHDPEKRRVAFRYGWELGWRYQDHELGARLDRARAEGEASQGELTLAKQQIARLMTESVVQLRPITLDHPLFKAAKAVVALDAFDELDPPEDAIKDMSPPPMWSGP